MVKKQKEKVMNRMKYMLAAAALLLLPMAAQAAEPGELKITVADYAATNRSADFSVTVDPSDLNITTQTLVIVTPVLRSTDGVHQHKFSPVALAGPVRYRIINREMNYGDFNFETEPGIFVKHRRKDSQSIPMRLEVPFQKWMRQSELVFVETRSGCAGCDLPDHIGTHHLLSPEFPAPYQPTFAVSYITPEVEPVKTRSDSYTARLSFQVNKSDLLRNFGDNASILAEADKQLSELQADPLLQINSIAVTGYASPEGNLANNQKLADNRARAFVNYLANTHNLRSGNVKIQSAGMGEDWEGLRKAVSDAPYLDDQQAVLNAIDNVGDIAKRKNVIKALSKGRTYRTLLNDFYPPLRRNEYTIAYTVRSFNAEEALQIYKERPQLLSLNELFMVANSYPAGSDEFKQVFDFASRMYPDSPAAQFNTAALEVESGAYRNAIGRLSDFDTPEGWNNLGVAYWHLGEHDKAEELLSRAAGAGNAVATENLAEFLKWEEDK